MIASSVSPYFEHISNLSNTYFYLHLESFLKHVMAYIFEIYPQGYFNSIEYGVFNLILKW